MLGSRTLAGAALAACLACSPPTSDGPSRGTVGRPPRPLDPAALRALPADHEVGALIYVPIYSSLFHPSGRNDIALSATLSIHNVALDRAITVSAVSYFDTEGRPLREFAVDPIVLEPMQTKQVVIARTDTSGGTGANFLVKWSGVAGTPPPAVEAVMLSTTSQQGISLTSHGTVIERLARPAAPPP